MTSGCWVSELLNDHGISVPPSDAFLLALCNGRNTVGEIEYIFSKTFDLERETANSCIAKSLSKLSFCIEQHKAPQAANNRYQPKTYLYDPQTGNSTNSLERFESPAEMTLVLTKKCSFRCIYCYNSSGLPIKNELSTDQWLNVIKQAKELDIVKCTLTGGEPMTHPGFFSILRKLVEKDISTYICTNGSLIDDTCIAQFKELSLPLIQISLDTPIEKEHDRLTCSRGSFSHIIHAIRELAYSGIKVYVKAVVLPESSGWIGQLIELCQGLGVSNLILDHYDLSYIGRGSNRFFLNKQQECEIKTIIESKKTHGSMNVNFLSGPRCWSGEKDIVTCGAFTQSFVIMPDGNYALCEKISNAPDMIVGNCVRMPLKAMWSSSKIDEIMELSRHKIEAPCEGCQHLAQCRTGCFAAKQFVSDNLYAPDPRCWKVAYKENQFITSA